MACDFKPFGEEENVCTRCGYVIWASKSKTYDEIVKQMIENGYDTPDCYKNTPAGKHSLHRAPEGFVVMLGDRTVAEEGAIDFSGLTQAEQRRVGWPERSGSMLAGLAVLRRKYDYDDVLDNVRADSLYKGFVEGFRQAMELQGGTYPSWDVEVEVVDRGVRLTRLV
jgi:hypothetical protein